MTTWQSCSRQHGERPADPSCTAAEWRNFTSASTSLPARRGCCSSWAVLPRCSPIFRTQTLNLIHSKPYISWAVLPKCYPIFQTLTLIYIKSKSNCTPSKALMDYELLERRVGEMGRLLFLSYLFLYIRLCYDLYSGMHSNLEYPPSSTLSPSCPGSPYRHIPIPRAGAMSHHTRSDDEHVWPGSSILQISWTSNSTRPAALLVVDRRASCRGARV